MSKKQSKLNVVAIFSDGELKIELKSTDCSKIMSLYVMTATIDLLREKANETVLKRIGMEGCESKIMLAIAKEAEEEAYSDALDKIGQSYPEISIDYKNKVTDGKDEN